jgi:hypothetical protein
MIRVMALVNDVFDEPQRNAIRVQGLQVKVIAMK